MCYKKYQYYRFHSSRPGTVFAKKATDRPEEVFFIMKDREIPSAEPCLILPAGLSKNRVKYLYRTVRGFVRPCYQNITCPIPTD
ncbi:hypothetical protein DPMN_053907 [Dreissena polymorpha]|uniref:Uncharacterized protein n=1 Tax=Dreissena polymorpha TaxID=45954 RepID=A0A9D4HR46_DREPO|nr:hypothetical protein DPMN_053907 [Dreissena polymorpha]